MSPGAPRLEVQFLPAREGDAIWLRWTGDDGAPHQAIIDMGKEETGRAFVERFRALPEDQRVPDLLGVTQEQRLQRRRRDGQLHGQLPIWYRNI